MDGSGEDNDAAAGEQPRRLPPADTPLHVLSDLALFVSGQARVDDILRYAPYDGHYYEDMIRFGGLASRGGGFGGHAYIGGEATRAGDGSAQDNDADAGEQPHPLPAGRPVLVVAQHENLYLIDFRSRDGGNGGHHGGMNGYGDDAYRGGGFGAVPASDDEIARLEKATVEDTREAECVVCMESFEEGDAIRKMPCSHGFHESCIFKWLRVSRLCPHCRFAIRAEDDWS